MQTFAWDHADLLLGLSGPPQNPRSRYNVAPSQEAAVVRADRKGRRRLSMLRWGLVPAWVRDSRIGHKLINVRAETARIKPSFWTASTSRRCLIPADGFYEWKREGGPKQPRLIGMKDRGPFAFAGLWERWTAREGVEPLRPSAKARRPGGRQPSPRSSSLHRLHDLEGLLQSCRSLSVFLSVAVANLHRIRRLSPGCQRGFRDDRRTRLGGRIKRLSLNEKRTFADGYAAAWQRTQTCQSRGPGFRGAVGAANGAAPTQPPAGSPGSGRAVPAQVEENESGILRTEMRTATLRNFARTDPGPAVPGAGEAGSPKRPRCWRKSQSAAGWRAGSRSRTRRSPVKSSHPAASASRLPSRSSSLRSS